MSSLVHIPCYHNPTHMGSPHKVLGVKLENGSTVFDVNPYCSDCRFGIMSEAMRYSECPRYLEGVQRQFEQEVGNKILEFSRDQHNNYDEFVYNVQAYHNNHHCEYCLNGLEEALEEFVVETLVVFSAMFGVRTERTTRNTNEPASDEAIKALERFATSSKQETTTCAICLDELEPNKKQVGARMPCKHEFHEGCIVDWLRKAHCCPLCRFELPTNAMQL